MPQDLFRSVVRPASRASSGSRVTVPLSLVAHAAALTALVVVPLIATDALPQPRRLLSVVIGQPVAPPEPPAPAVPAARVVQQVVTDSSLAPVTAPDGIAPERPQPLNEPAPDTLAPTGLIAGVGTVAVRDEPAPPPPVQPTRIRVGGAVTAPTRSLYVPPVYPPIAVAARKEGIVIIQATIGLDGRVAGAEILRSEPLLDDAALAAVRQWRYNPTRLNGEAVEVIMTVTVSFLLQR